MTICRFFVYFLLPSFCFLGLLLLFICLFVLVAALNVISHYFSLAMTKAWLLRIQSSHPAFWQPAHAFNAFSYTRQIKITRQFNEKWAVFLFILFQTTTFTLTIFTLVETNSWKVWKRPLSCYTKMLTTGFRTWLKNLGCLSSRRPRVTQKEI